MGEGEITCASAAVFGAVPRSRPRGYLQWLSADGMPEDRAVDHAILQARIAPAAQRSRPAAPDWLPHSGRCTRQRLCRSLDCRPVGTEEPGHLKRGLKG